MESPIVGRNHGPVSYEVERDMTAAEATLTRDPEVERVVDWRRAELERAGYDRGDARRLAERIDVDLHFAVDLRRRGCSSEIALDILL